MKLLGLILVFVGVAGSAAIGAQNTPDILERQRIETDATLWSAATTKAHTTYCEGRLAGELPSAHGCLNKADAEALAQAETDAAAAPETPADPDVAADAPAKFDPTTDFGVFKSTGLPEDLSALGEDWVTKGRTSVPAVAAADALGPLPEPGARFKTWFGQSGLPFSGAIALIVFGALLYRRGAKAEVEAETADAAKSSDGSGPKDLTIALGELLSSVTALHGTIAGEASPKESDFERHIETLSALQLETIEPIVESRERMKLRFGLAGYAAIMGPFAGAERNLNRSWSALVDSHWPEAEAALGRSVAGFIEAQNELKKQLAAAA